MEASDTHFIWNNIVLSAKSKFDYQHIISLFKKTDNPLVDKFLFHIIVAFASGEDHSTISINLFNELQHIGFECTEKQIDDFISDKHEKFSSEIYATYIAFTLLEDNEDPKIILSTINNLLEK